MKRKMIAMILALILLMSMAACGKQAEVPEEPTPALPTAQPDNNEPAETPEPTPAEPEWEAGLAYAAYAEAVYASLELGSEVEVIGAYKDYYVIAGEEYDLLVEKRFIRMENEEEFAAFEGYSYGNSLVFDNVYMRGESIAQLGLNTKISVTEGKADWVKVEWADGEGYMRASDASRYYIQTYVPNYGGGGGTPAAPADGTDVDIGTLSYRTGTGRAAMLGEYFGPEKEEDFEEGKGLVIADNVEAYLLLWQRDDQLKVSEMDEESITVWIQDEIYVTLPAYLVRLETDEEYESWNGFSDNGAVVYEEYQLRNEKTTLTRNTEVVVIGEIAEKIYSNYHPGCYIVLVDGEIGYMSLPSVGKTQFTVPQYYGGGANGGGGGGQVDVWTPPAL